MKKTLIGGVYSYWFSLHASFISGRDRQEAGLTALLKAAAFLRRHTGCLQKKIFLANGLALLSCGIQQSLPFYFGQSFSLLFHPGESQGWWSSIFFLVFGGVTSAILSSIEARVALRIRHAGVMVLEAESCKALLRKSVLDVKALEAGHIASHLNTNISAAAGLLIFEASLTRNVIMTLGSLILLAYINLLVVVMVVVLAVAYGAVIYRVTPKVADAYRIASDETARAASYLYQIICGVLDILVFGVRDFFESNYREKVRAKAESMISAGWISKRIDQSAYVIQLIGSFVILFSATRISSTHSLGVSHGIAALGILTIFWSSLRGAMTQLMGVQKNLPLLRRLQEWFEPLSELNELTNSTLHNVSRKDKGRIVFHDVYFGFSGAEQPVLKDVNFDICPGERVLLTGANGTGKTTLMLLMLGILKPTQGEILIDGVSCNKIREVDLRRLIVRVAHDSYIFPASAMENVIFGRAAWLDNACVKRAMTVAGCDSYFSHGSESIGEYGSRLSAGQRQRIIFARALAGGANVLLLDEATASIDAASTIRIYESVMDEALRTGQTVVVTDHHSDKLLPLVDRHFHVADGKLREYHDVGTVKRGDKYVYLEQRQGCVENKR